jgi:endonuclease G
MAGSGQFPFDTGEFEKEVRERIGETRPERERSRRLIAAGQGRLAEPDEARRSNFARRMAARELPIPEGAETTRDAIDFIDAVFLTLGARAARSVAHIVADQGRTSLGSGFMVSPSLFITNNHVLLDRDAAEHAWIAFNFEVGERLANVDPTLFKLRPDLFFHTVGWRDLDFTLVAVGMRALGKGELTDQGFCPLSDRPDKHAIGAAVNIVQHPNGWHKKIVLRENRIVSRLDRVLHYEADTEGGSSGSPVFNDAWEVVALHHWGKPFLETRTVDGQPVPIAVNEGVRISAIVKHLRTLLPTLTGEEKRLLQDALDASPPTHAQEIAQAPDAANRGEGTVPAKPISDGPIADRLAADRTGQASLIIPLEVTIRLAGSPQPAPIAGAPQVPQVPVAPAPVTPAPAGPERVVLDRNYKNRKGYDPQFLGPKLNLPLAKIVRPLAADIAPLNDDQPEHESGALKYQHFTVIMNEARRLAMLTATNIDGATYIGIDRETGLPQDAGAEGETWYDDDRISTEFFTGQRFYSATSLFFDRGHLTRRTDPTWGTPTKAVRANADTFHRTNSTPQHWLFNQSVKFWQGIERHYLEFGATLDRSRLTVLQGPVFTDNDPPYKDLDGNEIAVPLSFWKIVVRVENDQPKATGFEASHKKLLKLERGFVPRPDETVAPVVDEFFASIKRIESLTGLDLAALRRFDTFDAGLAPGAESSGVKPITAWEQIA